MENRYEIIRKLGEGGEGRVLLVKDHGRNGFLMALKRPSDPGMTKNAFAAEFSRSAALRHPNLAKAYDFGEDDEGLYFTSEFVDGVPIHQWAKTVSQRDVVRALGGLLRALCLLHDRDLVHGDISPSNILIRITGEPPGYLLKLLDLGEAGRPGRTGGRMTAGYAAPEILSGRGALFGSDLYAVGAIIAETLLGASPFGTGDASEIVRRQLSGEPQLPKADLSPIAALCRDLLKVEPSDRPRTASSVLKRLAEASEIDLALDLSELTAEDLPSPRLIQREKETALLVDFIEQFDDENGFRVAAIEGPRGSGRSALLEEAGRLAQLNGFGVIGSAKTKTDSEHFLSCLFRACGETSLSPISQKAIAPWSSPDQRSSDQRSSDRKSSDRRSSASAEDTGSVADISQVVFAALEALVAASQTTPKLIIIDDFSACDKVTKEVAAALSRALSQGRSGRPAALILTAFENDDHTLPEGLSRTIVSLKPLDSLGTAQLVSSMLPGTTVSKELCDAVFLGSSGLPKIAEEIVRQSVGAKSGTLTDLTLAKLRSLQSGERLLIAALGAVEGAIPASVFFDMGFDEATLLGLVKQGFLLESEMSGTSLFSAARSASSAAKQTASADEYLAFTERVGKTLEQDGLFRQAGALWRSIGRNMSALAAFRAAADERIHQGDMLGAAEYLETALDLWDGTSEIFDTARFAVETWRAVGWFEQAEKAVPLTGLNAEAASLLKAELIMEQGRHLEALSVLAETKGEFDPLKYASLRAACEMQLGRHERALSIIQESLNAASSVGPGRETAQLRQIGGLCCTYLGRMDRAALLLREAEEEFQQAKDRLGCLKVLGNLGLMYRRKGDLAEARRLYDAAVVAATALGDKLREVLHRMNRATVSQVACNFKDAYEDYTAALEIAEIMGNEFRTAQVEVNLADLLIDMGRGAQAAKTAARALKRCRAVAQERLETRALLAAGTAARVNGDFIRAEQRLFEALRRFSAAGDEAGGVFAKLRIAELFLDRQDNLRARALAEEVAKASNQKGTLREYARALVLLSRCDMEDERTVNEALKRLDDAESALKREPSQDTLMHLSICRARVLEKLGKNVERLHAIDTARSLFKTLLDKVPETFREDYVEHLNIRNLFASAPSEAPEPADRWARDLEMLMEINRELTSERDSKRLLSMIMESAVNLTGAERGMLVMPKSGKLEPVISHQISEEIDRSFSRSVAEKVVLEGRAVLAVDALGDERFRAFVSVNALKLRSILAVPLKIKRRVVGAVYLDSRLQTGVFSDADRRLLEAFGAQAAVCLETARLISENQERCRALNQANEEIKALSEKLKDKLEKNEAKLVRVGALLEKTQSLESEKIRADGMVGRSPAMQQVHKLIERIAPANVPVYIFGASGTGKELAARAIHSLSERKSKPFVAVNCGALPSKLLAGELFGHKKGAFTGAVADRPGLFKVADKGTLFLDEVSDMDKEMQTHLLRVLQDGTFRSLGDNEELSVDVRILAASNRDLEEEVKAGRFREDLFYRLNVVRVDLPPLSERREDIPLLIESLVRRHAKDKEPARFAKEAVDLLMAADWPGNVRELENEILRAVTMASDQNAVSPEDLSPRFMASSKNDAWAKSGLLKDRVQYFEETVIRRTVSECGNNSSKAARVLGISRATLYKKLEKAN